jgi:hypothetical protein
MGVDTGPPPSPAVWDRVNVMRNSTGMSSTFRILSPVTDQICASDITCCVASRPWNSRLGIPSRQHARLTTHQHRLARYHGKCILILVTRRLAPELRSMATCSSESPHVSTRNILMTSRLFPSASSPRCPRFPDHSSIASPIGH